MPTAGKARALFVALVLLTAGVPLVRCTPYWLSYYNGLIGGLRGAADRGMQVSYWFDAATPTFFCDFARVVPAGSRIAVWPSPDSCAFQSAHGMLSATYRFVSLEFLARNGPGGIEMQFAAQAPEYLLVLNRPGSFNAFIRHVVKQCVPLLQTQHDGVPLVMLYRF